MKYIERAISLEPASKDAWEGPKHEYIRAKIAARFGQKDLAISILAHLLTIPYQDQITPAWLRLDPDFDPLRNGSALPETLPGQGEVTHMPSGNSRLLLERKKIPRTWQTTPRLRFPLKFVVDMPHIYV
jgi:hypothetical protein